MKLLGAFKGIPRHLPTGLESKPPTAKHRVVAFAKDKVERAVYATALGGIKGYYYDKAVFKGLGVEAWVGAIGYIGSALMGGNKHLERAGDAGMTTYLYSLGASWGADKAGRGIATTAPKQLPAQQGQRRVSAPVQQMVGYIPPRAGGAFLSADDIANSGSPR